MMPFTIKPDGSDYSFHNIIPPEYMECSEQPPGEVLNSGWEVDPTDATVAWRAKTAAEIDAEKRAEATREIDKDKLIKLIALVLFNHENRIRVLEGEVEIDLPTFKQALIDRY